MRRLALILALATLPGVASAFEELEFMIGHWSCEALGGTAEEIWLPANGDVMHAVFRLLVEDEMQVAEFIQVTREEGQITMRFAHFRPDYSMQEGDGPPLALRLVESRAGYARFAAADPESPDAEYQLTPDGILEVRVTGVDEPFRFQRVD